ncbi:D-lactaldehyde dehydrogenase [Rhizoctonia solani 123E]|uniref:D-lactaldehyde dehydrogenase n=1 Tax=Rhizoctonia solani 123E TaxID=1423351 RepID=A0A074RRI8_9AGAM|nr:D-lactaldehyde dehydrogenase [Rhizoctonia solani 123E]
MPSIQTPAIVLVTGASGFVAAWVCKTFLDAGYTVRGTVRSHYKGEQLANIFKESEGRFQHVIVEDMTIDGAFDEAVKDVQGVLHLACPTTFIADDPQELIGPALNGTLSVLRSIEKYAPDVRRVVYTSSAAAIIDEGKPLGTIFTDDDWNELSVKEVEEKGKNAGKHKYRASKVLAERAAWSEAKKQGHWDLVAIHPVVTLGPMIHPVSRPSQLNTSISMLYNIISKKDAELSQEELLTFNNFGDVRDVALAHLRAMQYEHAGGQRFITANGAYTWQDALDALPAPYPRGISDSGKTVGRVVFDGSKARTMLGINYRSFEDSVRDTAEDLRQRGWLLV